MRFFLNTLIDFMRTMVIPIICITLLTGIVAGHLITLYQLKQLTNKKLSVLVQREQYLKAVINSNKKFNTYLAIKKHYADKLIKLNTKFTKALASKELAEIKYYKEATK